MREGDVAFVMVRVTRIDEHPKCGATAICEVYDGESKKVIPGDYTHINPAALVSPTVVAQRVMAKLGDER